MENLYLNNDNLSKYKKEEIYSDIFHVESSLYKYKNNIILKIFDDYMYKKLMQDKRHKVSFFKKENFSFLTNPLFDVYVSNYFAGYAMYQYDGKNIKEYINMDDTNSIELLRLVSRHLHTLHSNNIIFGDINTNNILTNGKSVKFCDIDSFGTPYSTPTTLPYILYQNSNIPNENMSIHSDLFIVNLIMLDILMDININDIADMSIYEYKDLIKSLKFSNYLNKIYLNLYDNLLCKGELIYPEVYLEELVDIKKKRKV